MGLFNAKKYASKEGIKGTQEIMVTKENTAKVMGSGAVDVFATPAMIALMEKTAWESVHHIRRREAERWNVNECKTCGRLSRWA